MIKPSGAYDPDYGSLWSIHPGHVSRRGVDHDGVATVRLANVGTPSLKGSPVTAPAVAAVQQLIWTATASRRYRREAALRRLADGDAVGACRSPACCTARRPSTTLAPVWIIDPQAESHVRHAGDRSPGRHRVRGHDPASGAQHAPARSSRTGRCSLSVGAPAQGTATVKLTLKPGQYTIEAYELSLRTVRWWRSTPARSRWTGGARPFNRRRQRVFNPNNESTRWTHAACPVRDRRRAPGTLVVVKTFDDLYAELRAQGRAAPRRVGHGRAAGRGRARDRQEGRRGGGRVVDGGRA